MRKTILVIDDHPDIRENTAEILSLAGYIALTADNGKRGVELAIREKPDLIICDIMMPELDGYGVLHMLNLNAETRHIPFIFLTAKTERSDFRKGMEMGADDYITKPFEEVELLKAVETRLKKKEISGQPYAPGAGGLSEFIRDARAAGLADRLKSEYDIVPYGRKSVLFQEGNRPRYLFYIVSGKVKTVRQQEGKEYIVDLSTAGDFLGHTAIIEEKNYEVTAIALEDTEVIQMPKDDFLQLIHGDASIASRFIRLIAQNVKEKEERLVTLAYSSLRKRVAQALADIHDKFNQGGQDRKIEISRDDIARYVGTATESLIRTLSDFKAEKRIEIRNGKILIPDVSRLRNMLY